ncbi:MAG: hypothetical protein KKG00_01615, partial [Bacteroidetes bacterium]|nr:hypothetical protein [Bacteroidota bacterium]
ISFHESFLYWAPGRLPQDIQEFIYVNDELGEDIPRLFDEVREVGRIQNPYAREHGTRVYLCRQPKTSIRAMFLAKIPRMTPF